jgi:hypothetical protein
MRHAVLITVIADVVRHYINIRGLEARLEFARNNVATAQKTLDIVQTRFDRGLRQLAVLQARPSDLTAAILDARSRMAILRGTYSEEIAPEWRRRRGIPRIPDYVRPGLPLDLLRRRPDIRQAEREVAAATARIGAATADLFPTVSVTTGFGAQGGPPPQQRSHGRNAANSRANPVNRTKRLLACPGFRTLGCPYHRPGTENARTPGELQENHSGGGRGKPRCATTSLLHSTVWPSGRLRPSLCR